MSDASAPGDAAVSPDWLLGVNLAGAEFAPQKDPGTYGFDYIYPSHSEIDYYANAGLSVIRLPFLWERLQSSTFAPLDARQLAHIDDVVDYANSKGLKVILDAHDYGSYEGSLIGSSAVPNSAFADVWGQLAGHYAGNANVIFDLMNEPHAQPAPQWLDSINAAIAAIRDAGATSQEILVSGTHFDGAWTWAKTDNAAVIGTGVQDPSHNFAFDVHQYLDYDGSGTHAGAVSTSIGVDRLAAITDWAEATGSHLFLGEFGAGTDQTSLAALDNMLTYMQSHSDAWEGAAYWAGGPWWGNYMYSIEPANGADKPQMDVLQNHLLPVSPPSAVAASGVTIAERLAHDTGASNTDFITKDGHVTLLGTLADGGHVTNIEIFDGSTDLGAARLVPHAWTFSTLLAEGSHDLRAVATDADGNSTGILAPDMVTVDLTGAVPVITNAAFDAASGLTTFSGTSAPGDTVTIYDKGPVLIGTAAVAADGTWSLRAGVGSGPHSYIEKSADLAGNTGNSTGHTLYAADAGQYLAGGSGNDVLIAGAGDTLKGGAGSDTFVFNPGLGNVKVGDFEVNNDVLSFDHTLLASASQVLDHVHDTAAGAVIGIDADQSVTLTNVHLADLQAHTSDFHFF